ncbi:hypothetical protein A3F29_02205 [Candidatus Roizmanbacteria bacterium RIFCSPHIGHO2_12_FULL_33_9]|uniref:Leucine--tRNA ligase n=1 Tax=Candidatus Roizmanbacteria bacterium RIFCSPHIGHO2_12_FULL_33_9 TaxID=1802045 RepID=A0A1F7HJ57_9BACT|nr:MAG: hypothetical protein A3F29_02205 [Candidatus Roizmanbacteria bacterium RIFCSPHIGHO2_12_FULL_33_9]
MKSKYLPKKFEQKWVDKWEKDKIYKTPGKEEKSYVLDMFPYPSGDGLHVGHARIYTASDVLARFFRLKGKSVLHPMGWDAFGLPAENAAIKAKKNPIEMVPKNIERFKNQMKTLGLSYDWDREFSTTDPNYYKWTQWLFIQFFKSGLLFKKSTPVYYCEFCKTGLAEEEVTGDGKHERCGNEITRKTLPQWIFRITLYADKLLDDLDGLDWPNGIKKMQKNWIGKSKGAEISFKVISNKSSHFAKASRDKKVKGIVVFTTKPETISSATAIIIAPEHSFASELKKNNIKKYISDSKKKLDIVRTDLNKNKTGIFTGFYAENPYNNEKIPIWIADYVVGWYGYGALMSVPGGDKRDLEFAKKYNLQVKKLDKKIDENKLKSIARESVQYKLRDWIFSRQRYWGEPIPMVFCQRCADKKITWWDLRKENKSKLIHKMDNLTYENLYGWFPMDEKDLPLKLPYLKSYEPGSFGESPLSKVEEWTNTSCPNCKSSAKRETDTMPNWAGSCWYFLRFTDPKNIKQAWSKSLINDWLPVDWYLGGAEHAVLHLLYSRFWVKALYSLKLLNIKEPFYRLRNVGLVIAQDSRKMSKSFGNIINPDDIIEEFGVDTLRITEMFMAPFSQEIAWSAQTLQGSYRFLKRVWQIVNDPAKVAKDKKNEDITIVAELQTTISNIESSIANVKFNTGVSFLMEFLNSWEKSNRSGKMTSGNIKKFLKILSPYAPFITEELWTSVLKEKESIHLSKWPEIDQKAVIKKAIKIPVQVNGKLRGVVSIESLDLEEKKIAELANKDSKIRRYLKDQDFDIIYVKGKILNFVTK